MDKLRVAVAALVLLLLLTACGCAGGETSVTWKDQLSGFGVVRIGITPNYPPYADVDGEGNIVGYDVDFIAFIGEHLGIEIDLISMEFNGIVEALQEGSIDLGISCFTYREGRPVEYSDSYLDMTQGILVRADSDIARKADLAGGSVSGKRGNDGLDYCYELQAELEEMTVIVGEEPATSVEALLEGAFDAYIAEREVLEAYAKESEDRLVVLPEELGRNSIYVLAKRGHGALIEKINEVIAVYRASEASRENFIKWFH